MAFYYPRDDVPIYLGAHDRLNREHLTKRLLEAICYGDLPQVMGVEGDWGSGKTSLLQRLFWDLEGKVVHNRTHDQKDGQWTDQDHSPDISNIRAVWFEAWRYQHEPEPIIALLHEIRSQLMSGEKWKRFVKTLQAKGGAFASMTIHGLTTWFGELISSVKLEAGGMGKAGELLMPAKVTVGLPDPVKHAQGAMIVQQAEEARLRAERLEEPLRSEQICDQLHAAISLFLGQGLFKETKKTKDAAATEPAPRLVIIIDDLDRCAPDAVCRLLESIKIHLDLPSCFFVLGLNRRHVETSLTTKLADAFHASDDSAKERVLRARAADYVEKICTNLIRIPRPDPQSCINLAAECLTGLDWPAKFKGDAEDEVSLPNLASSIKDMLNGGDFVPLPSNPRRIKALCNQFQLAMLNADSLLTELHSLMASPQSEEFQGDFVHDYLSKIFIFAALRQFFPDLYRMLETAPRFYGSLHEWCASPPPSVGPVTAIQESEASHVLNRLNPIARNITTSPGMAVLSGPATLLPDPHEGIAFFIQELIVRTGSLKEDEVRALTSIV